jgi:hypothetical protein
VAHTTQEKIDELAALHAQDPEGFQPAVIEDIAPPPTLAYGATGEHVSKLMNLLSAAGHHLEAAAAAEIPVLSHEVLDAVSAFRHEVGVVEPEVEHVLGELVGPETWKALYQAAEKALAGGGA